MAQEFHRAQPAKLQEIIGQLSRSLGPKTAASAAQIRETMNKLARLLQLQLTAEDHAL